MRLNIQKMHNKLLGNNKSNKGFLTFDFLFSFVMVFGIFFIFMIFCFFLVASEMAQYVSYSVAREYHAGHVTESGGADSQRSLAQEKFDELTQTPGLRRIFSDDFFALKFNQNSNLGDFGDIFPGSDFNTRYVGSMVELEAPVLNIQLPLIGSTAVEGQNFTARVFSFLYREPTQQECNNFMTERVEGLPGRLRQVIQGNAVILTGDNGC